MPQVIYRKLVKEDYNSIKELICEAFGFREFIKSQKLLGRILTLYLYGCICDSSFSKVAVKDDKVIGIILGKANVDKHHVGNTRDRLDYFLNIIKIAFTKKEARKVLKEFSKLTETYKEIIAGKESYFQGAIQLFIVSKECRGLGVGKALVAHVFDYMHSMDVKSLYLYTDSRCNYGFYDSQNFKRIGEKKIYFNSLNNSLDVFLYKYDL